MWRQLLKSFLQHCLSFLVKFKKPQTGWTSFHCGSIQTKLKASDCLSLLSNQLKINLKGRQASSVNNHSMMYMIHALLVYRSDPAASDRSSVQWPLMLTSYPSLVLEPRCTTSVPHQYAAPGGGVSSPEGTVVFVSICRRDRNTHRMNRDGVNRQRHTAPTCWR